MLGLRKEVCNTIRIKNGLLIKNKGTFFTIKESCIMKSCLIMKNNNTQNIRTEKRSTQYPEVKNYLLTQKTAQTSYYITKKYLRMRKKQHRQHQKYMRRKERKNQEQKLSH